MCTDALVAFHEHVSCLYSFGGACGHKNAVGSMERYVPKVGRWEAMPHEMQIRGISFASAVLQGRIYLCGVGFDVFGGKVMVFDAHSGGKNAWTVLRGHQAPHILRSEPAVAVIAGRLYLCGGKEARTSEPLDSSESFDPVADGPWELLPSMSHARVFGSASPFASRLLVCGGHAGSTDCHATCEYYDPSIHSWTAAPTMTQGRWAHSAACMCGTAFICGGYSPDSFPDALSSIEFLKPENDAWERGPAMQVARCAAGAGVIGRKLYICGGASGHLDFGNGEQLNSVEVLDSNLSRWQMATPMTVTRSSHTSAVSSA